MNPVGGLKEVSSVAETEQLDILALVNVYPGGEFSAVCRLLSLSG